MTKQDRNIIMYFNSNETQQMSVLDDLKVRNPRVNFERYFNINNKQTKQNKKPKGTFHKKAQLWLLINKLLANSGRNTGHYNKMFSCFLV